jgi:hypothetical protein
MAGQADLGGTTDKARRQLFHPHEWGRAVRSWLGASSSAEVDQHRLRRARAAA